MKKVMALLGTVILLTFATPFTSALAEDPIINSIDEKLEMTDPYYQSGSAKVMDFTDIIMEVSITEEEVEKQKIKMVFVKYKTDRDTIFHFNKQEILYYSLDGNTLLESDSVIGSKESKEFIEGHQDDYRKQISPGSLILILSLIFAMVIVLPLLIALFHRNSPSDEMYHHEL